MVLLMGFAAGNGTAVNLLDRCSSLFLSCLHVVLSLRTKSNMVRAQRGFSGTYYGRRHREHLYLPGLISQTPQRLAFGFRTEGASPLSLAFCWVASAPVSDTCACWLPEMGFSSIELAAASMPDISAGAEEAELSSASPWRASDAIVCVDRWFAAGCSFNVRHVCDTIKV